MVVDTAGNTVKRIKTTRRTDRLVRPAISAGEEPACHSKRCRWTKKTTTMADTNKIGKIVVTKSLLWKLVSTMQFIGSTPF
jgi:hypothetical protein